MSAPKGNKNAVGNKGGRPQKYKSEYAAIVYNMGLLGATDADLAQAFDVASSTLNKWKLDHIEFAEALKGGKMRADAEVALSFLKRAKGYRYEEKYYQDGKLTRYVEKEHPPDASACINWLKNRQPKYWRDKQEVEHSLLDVDIIMNQVYGDRR